MNTRHIVIDARVRRSSTGRYADQLVEHLQDIDHDNRYTILVAPDDTWRMHSPNFRTTPSPFPQFSFNPLNELRFALQLYRLKPDLVHFTMTQQPLLYFGNIVTMTHDLTMLHFIRRGTTPLPVYWLKKRLYAFLMWWSHRKSRRIVVPAKTIANELAAYQPFTKHKTTVIYESIGVLPKIKPKKPATVNGTYLMYQGTFFPHKNLDRLVAAFDIVHQKKPDLSLVMVGKAEVNQQELAERIKTHPSKGKIILTGFLPDNESRWTFEHATLYVMPSLMEGFSMTALEAMAYGCPVVSSNASVMPEVYGPGAHYFDPLSPEDIAAKIIEVLDNPTLKKQLIASGYKQVKKYSWEKLAAETYTVYRQVLGIH
ncbi:MAG TPA: glycosyltransferase family 1 protein [Candidatus Saccharimonadales bacterium]|nr:glycosyltransferase family 1 protein [Candidatus Saccharimonadales bacterium]